MFRTLILFVACSLLSACATTSGLGNLVTDPPKPVVDYRLLEACDTVLPPLGVGASMIDYLDSHKLVVTKLDACACRHISLRNLTCKLVANKPCEVIPECEAKINAQ